jgi:S1-C subfamily serine protease
LNIQVVPLNHFRQHWLSGATLRTVIRSHEKGVQSRVTFAGTSGGKVPGWLKLLGTVAFLTVGSGVGANLVDKALIAKSQKQQAQFEETIRDLDKALRQLDTAPSVYNIPTLASRILPSTVTVKYQNDALGDEKVGSGLWLKDNKGQMYILTGNPDAYGIYLRVGINKIDPFQIELYNGSDLKQPVKMTAHLFTLPNGQISASREDNFALLAVDNPNLIPASVKPIQIGGSPAYLGKVSMNDKVVAASNAVGTRDNITKGAITMPLQEEKTDPSDKVLPILYFDAPVNPGAVGGGLYDLDGNAIGLIIDDAYSSPKPSNDPLEAEAGSHSSWVEFNDGHGKAILLKAVIDKIQSWGIDIPVAKSTEAGQ